MYQKGLIRMKSGPKSGRGCNFYLHWKLWYAFTPGRITIYRKQQKWQLKIGKLIALILDQSQIRPASLPAKWAKVSEELAVIKLNVAQPFLSLSHDFSLTYYVTYYLSKPAVLSICRSKGVRFDPPSSFWGRGTFGGSGALRGSPERSIARIAWELYESLSKNYSCKEREFPEKVNKCGNNAGRRWLKLFLKFGWKSLLGGAKISDRLRFWLLRLFILFFLIMAAFIPFQKSL